jgi:hypothetical protein
VVRYYVQVRTKSWSSSDEILTALSVFEGDVREMVAGKCVVKAGSLVDLVLKRLEMSFKEEYRICNNQEFFYI